MKPKFRASLFHCLTTVTLAFTLPSATAISYYWDSNTTTGGAGTTPTGTWGTSTFWSTNSAGTTATANSTINAGDDVFFSAGTDAAGTYSVALNGSKNARLVTFEEGTVSLSGNTLVLYATGNTGGITVTGSTVVPAISSNLTLQGGETFNVATGRTLTLGTGTFTRANQATLNIRSTGTVTSTMSGFATNTNNIVGPWASFNTAASTTYAVFSGSNIAALGYTGSTDGVAVTSSTSVTDTTELENYTLNAAGTLGASAAINTLRYTGAAGTLTTSSAFSTNGLMNSGTGTLTISGAVTIGSTKELVVNSANAAITLSNSIEDNGSGSSGLTKTGTGTLTLSTSNNYTGKTTISQGTLTVGSSAALGDGSATNALVLGGGTLALATSSTINSPSTRPITVAGGGTIDTTNGAVSLAGAMSGAGWLTKNGTNPLTISGSVSGFTGNYNISAGMLRVDQTLAATSSVHFNNGFLGLGANFSLAYSNSTNQGVPGTFSVPSNNGAGWAAYGGARTVSVSGTPTWFNGKPINFGAADSDSYIIYSGNLTTQSSASVTRPLVVTRGNGTSSIDAMFSGVISEQANSLSGVSVTGNGIFAATGNNSFTGNFIIGGTSTIVANSLAASGTASPIGKGTFGFAIDGGTFQYAPVAGTGGAGHTTNRNFAISTSGKLDASGTGPVVFSQTDAVSPDVTGLAFTTTGSDKNLTLTAGNNTNLSIGMTISGTGITPGTKITNFQVNGVVITNNPTNFAAGSGTASFGYPTSRTLTLTGTNTDANTIAGILQNSSSVGTGVISIAKTGIGTWVLSGPNTHTGTTTISGGILDVNTIADSGSSALGLGSSLVLSGGTLSYSGTSAATTTRAVSLSANSGIDLPSGALTLGSGIAGIAFTLTKSSAGTLTLSGSADNSSLFLTVTGGVVELDKSSDSARAVAGISGISSGATVKLTGTGIDQIYDGSFFVSTNGVNGLDGTLDLNGKNETTSNLNGGSSGVVDNTSGTACTFTVGNQGVSSTFSGTIQNTGASLSITKIGAGTLTLSGANTYSGGTTLNQGTLTVDTGGTLGAATGALAVNNANSTLAGTAAILNLANAVDTTVGTLSGTLATPTSGTNTATINNGGTGRNFTVNQTVSGTYAGVIAGAGGLTLGSLSTNTLTLSGVNTYGGGSTINAGTLILGSATALGTSAATVNGGSLDLGGQTITNTVSTGTSGTLTGSGSTGAATLAGSMTPGGSSSGLITMASASVASTSSITLQLAATGTRGTNYDAITVSSPLALDGTITVTLNGLTPAAGQSFDLIDSTGAIDVTNFTVATDLVLPALSGGLVWDTSNFAAHGVISIANSDPYTTWSGGAAFNVDSNGDGVKNGLAWLLGAANKDANALGLLPSVTQSGGDLTLTFDCLSAANRGTAVLNVQYSNDLGLLDLWTNALVPGVATDTTVNNVHFVTTAPGSLIHVVATIPSTEAAAGKLFGRLDAETTP